MNLEEPSKQYFAYKPSGIPWLGGVPDHWEVRRAKFFYREVDERSTYWSRGVDVGISHNRCDSAKEECHHVPGRFQCRIQTVPTRGHRDKHDVGLHGSSRSCSSRRFSESILRGCIAR